MRRLRPVSAAPWSLAIGSVIALPACSGDAAAPAPDPVAACVRCPYPVVDPAVEGAVSDLLGRMTLAEKVDQMHGSSIASVGGLYYTPDNARLGIPPFKMSDGPRGVRVETATTFPVGSARGATWDLQLEERVGEVMGRELRARGGNVLLAPTINLLLHPAWGRAQETYGEDGVHMAALGTAFVRGAQRYALASVKHFAVNNIEDTRLGLDVTIDLESLHDTYLRHFQRVIQDARAATVMCAYNSVNGHFACENDYLLRDVLKGAWAFDGLVMSDWVFATHSTAPAVNAGLDVEMPQGVHLGDDLIAAVGDGSVTEAIIDDAVTRILRKKVEFGLDALEPVPVSVVESKEHTDVAYQVALESGVLLKNEGGVLPFAPGARVAVVGPMAAVSNLGDHGSSNAVPSWSVSPLQGLRDRLGPERVTAITGPTLTAGDEAAIAAADVAVVVAGLDWEDEGEDVLVVGGDRDTLELDAEQVNLIRAVRAQNPHTVVVLEGGSAITGTWIDEVPALMMAWYPGQEGGHAIADLLSGAVGPSGKLAVTFPHDAGELPPFDHASVALTYDRWQGYRYVDHVGGTPRYPFGYGLAYTSFELSRARLERSTFTAGGSVNASVTVRNTGARDGVEVVQIYASAPSSRYQRPVRWLVGFARVPVPAGKSVVARVTLFADDFAAYDTQLGRDVVEAVPYTLSIGTSSRELPLTATVSGT